MVAPVAGQFLNKNLFRLLENHRQPAQLRKPKICLEGSSRSGKTWSGLEYCINLGKNMPGIVISVFRNDAATHKGAGVRDFKTIMATKFPDEWAAGTWNATDKHFTFENGAFIEFIGANDAQKLQGPERDVAYYNECMEISYEAYRQITARTRLLEIFDWNPSLNSHWVFDRIMKRDDVLYVHSTYRDNPHLSAKQVHEIECTNPNNPENVRQGTADEWFWDVYGLGKRGRREGAIFKNYDIIDYWPKRSQCEKWGFGDDFGFSNDPNALIECALFQGKLHLREWLYEKNLITCINHSNPSVPSIEGRLQSLKFDKKWKVKADCARPEQIKELVTAGYNFSGCVKGKGSVVAGIQLMKRFPICIHIGSNNLQMEFQQYVWARHADGTWLDEPEDDWNHAIDAVRYWAMDELTGWLPTNVGGNQYPKRNAAKKKRY